MKQVIYIILVLSAISCMKLSNNEYYIHATGQVDIIHAVIPDTVDNMSVNHIIAGAKAPDQCWSGLNFILSKDNDFEYSLKAFGLYESFGTCAPGVVYGDSAIMFKPTKTGLYKFNIFKASNDIMIDTMIVR